MRRNARSVAAVLAGLLALAVLSGCSREKIDWKSAESADTVESYDHFIERHPDSALATQARTRVAQLNEDRDWKKATTTDTADAYRQFLAEHESGKWAEEARIRVENFSLDGTATGPAKPIADAEPAVAATTPVPARGPKESQLPPPAAPAHGPKEAQLPPTAVAATPPAGAPAKPAVAATKSAVEPKPGNTPKTAVLAGAAKNNAGEKHLAMGTPSAAKPTAAASSPAKSSPSASAVTPPPDFGIQLGAFHSQDAALKNWKQLQAKYDSDLHGLFAHAVPVKQTSGDLFRLQAPVGDEGRARAICASLTRQSQPCVVVLPRP